MINTFKLQNKVTDPSLANNMLTVIVSSITPVSASIASAAPQLPPRLASSLARGV